MTTADLIKILQKLPQDAKVYTEDGEGHRYCVITNVVAITVANINKDKSIVRIEWKYEKETTNE